MKIRAINEYNQDGHMIYADNYVGAYVRGRTQAEAMGTFHEVQMDCNFFDMLVYKRCLHSLFLWYTKSTKIVRIFSLAYKSPK